MAAIMALMCIVPLSSSDKNADDDPIIQKLLSLLSLREADRSLLGMMSAMIAGVSLSMAYSLS